MTTGNYISLILGIITATYLATGNFIDKLTASMIAGVIMAWIGNKWIAPSNSTMGERPGKRAREFIASLESKGDS